MGVQEVEFATVALKQQIFVRESELKTYVTLGKGYFVRKSILSTFMSV
jgi:hypothetical protein